MRHFRILTGAAIQSAGPPCRRSSTTQQTPPWKACKGLSSPFSLLRVSYNPNFVWRRDAPVAGKVSIISGSGSGHEPLNIGYVGPGMLDAACPGSVFTSPTRTSTSPPFGRSVWRGGRALRRQEFRRRRPQHRGGAELAREECYNVASVLIHDDVSIDQSDNRRGMGAAILVERSPGPPPKRDARWTK